MEYESESSESESSENQIDPADRTYFYHGLENIYYASDGKAVDVNLTPS
jgi:hypothetical protein